MTTDTAGGVGFELTTTPALWLLTPPEPVQVRV
jgi:hypothetical protein